jgi:SAM-dependent methyltransferase
MHIKIWLNKRYYELQSFIVAWTDPVPWVIEKQSHSILDVGCGQGNPMNIIKKRMNVGYSVGVDIFKPYLDYCKKEKIFSKVVLADVRKLSFPDKSFDVVLLDQIVEHLTEKEAWSLIKKAEKIARRQVIIATPIGECFHPSVDDNKYQLHKSAYYPEDLQKRGYSTIRYGWKTLLDEHSHGFAYKVKRNPVMRRLLYLLNILLTPFYYLFQNSCDYIFVAYKDIS